LHSVGDIRHTETLEEIPKWEKSPWRHILRRITLRRFTRVPSTTRTAYNAVAFYANFK